MKVEKAKTVEFKWEEVLEDDCSWEFLAVRIDGGKWRMAKPLFGTEDEKEILEKLK
ncbi:hypothetical protein N9955_00665 [bacterium]|nr:hypothetical protein [bacterium]